MANPSQQDSHLTPLDKSHGAVAAVVASVVRQELADFVRNLLPALRDTFAEQLTAQKRVLDAVNNVCDEQAARLEYFVKLSKRARDTLEKLTAEAAVDTEVDEAEEAMPSVDSLLGGLLSQVGGSTGPDGKVKLPTKLERMLEELRNSSE